MVPELIATDFIPYPTVDIVLDATRLPFPSRSVRCFVMLNTFHHIADCGRFLEEAARCLVPGGRILIIDQHRGFISTPILIHASAPFAPDNGPVESNRHSTARSS
jgi:ubiquinone/menaquinone biosynthesis C-methylase UbiE